ncbi:MAG: glycosyltransferase family 1 protein [Phascolarctobacterium sp.]|uniref:glycosyltransferase family 1 protein n=1 Tax=Phascolarctobacterium sp. TaxID=2049039 RepID=UPI0026DB7548|nr:glycosyltransferase family 1 protein [Phascolarctobacterium sp.]MDO4921921.1 glycosyltransferase family 1 protein [Phascolarctobacterium sp.]
MNNKVKILQIGMTRNIGGLETYLMQQFDNIDKNKLQYDFVNITSEYDIVFRDKIVKKGSRIYNILSRHKNPIRHYWQWIKLLSNVGKQYKGIILNSNSLTYIYPLFIAKFFGISIRVLHSHNAGFEGKVSLFRKSLIYLNRILMDYSVTDYFACSDKAGQWMFPSKDYRVIHNAIDPEPYCFDSKRRNKIRMENGLVGKFVVGHVGRFTYQKNQEFLIRLWQKFSEIYPASLLLLVGSGEKEAEIKRLAQTLKLNNILYLGQREDVPELMQAMDCFVLPSHFEGLCLVGIEAQAAGLPCFFADKITREVGITRLANFISLNEPDKWISAMGECKDTTKRKNMLNEVTTAGYDINLEIKNMEAIYLKGRKITQCTPPPRLTYQMRRIMLAA